MAHELSSDVRKFASLEHVDAGTPKTTDLDEAIGAGDESHCRPQAAGSQRAGREQERPESESCETRQEIDRNDEERGQLGSTETTGYARRETTRTTIDELRKMDQEDIITVKYLPINSRATNSGSAPQIADGHHQQDAQAEIAPPPPSSSTNVASAPAYEVSLLLNQASY